MDNDDRPIGHLLSRREALALLGAIYIPMVSGGSGSSSATPTATSTSAPSPTATILPSCVVRPALTEGPYFVDEKLNRSDIRSDPSDGTVKAGLQLDLTFRVSKLTGSACVALAGATMDVWHCDALGVYSDVSDATFGNQTGKKFLRGYQATDAHGAAQFTTIYPGWYQGRATHIHFKIRTTTSGGASYDFTSQLFFDDAVNDLVYTTVAPYATKGATGRLRNSGDGIYQGGGSQLLLALSQTSQGYAAALDVALQIS